MMRPMVKWVIPACLALALSLCSLQAQTQRNFVTLHDISAVPGLHTNTPIAMPTNRSGGREALSKATASPFSGTASPRETPESHEAPDEGDDLRFPGDLQYHGGPTIKHAQSHSIFVNPTSGCHPNSCWGDPVGFLEDLGRSQFIHVTDQYVHDHAWNRYTTGTNLVAPSFTPSAGAGQPFTDGDLAFLAYAAAQFEGFGYHHIYHIFLRPGQDVCFDNTFSVCYSPDNLSTYFFCAYHGAVFDQFGNIALYSVEPYQNVFGCSVRPDTPNGQLADSTNSVLSHELIETITDPLGSGWWNQLDNGLYGEEIADECSFLLFTATDVFFDPSNVRLNHKKYAIQPEYSNWQHACTTNNKDDD